MKLKLKYRVRTISGGYKATSTGNSGTKNKQPWGFPVSRGQTQMKPPSLKRDDRETGR